MSSLAWFAFVALILTGVATVAYVVGRDTAERAADRTISTLRGELRTARLDAIRATKPRHPTARWSPDGDPFDPRMSGLSSDGPQ